MGVLHQLE